MVATDRDFDYDDYSSSSERSTNCCRAVALIVSVSQLYEYQLDWNGEVLANCLPIFMLQFPFHLTFYAVHGSIGPPPYSSNHNQWSRGEFICIILSKTQRWYMVLLIVVHYNSLQGKHFFHGVLILFSYQTVVAVAYCWNTSASLYNGTSINSNSTSTATTGSSHFVIRRSSQNGLNGYDDRSTGTISLLVNFTSRVFK